MPVAASFQISPTPLGDPYRPWGFIGGFLSPKARNLSCLSLHHLPTKQLNGSLQARNALKPWMTCHPKRPAKQTGRFTSRVFTPSTGPQRTCHNYQRLADAARLHSNDYLRKPTPIVQHTNPKPTLTKPNASHLLTISKPNPNQTQYNPIKPNPSQPTPRRSPNSYLPSGNFWLSNRRHWVDMQDPGRAWPGIEPFFRARRYV